MNLNTISLATADIDEKSAQRDANTAR